MKKKEQGGERTVVQDIFEDQLGRLCIERGAAIEELKQAHAQGPPVGFGS